MTETKRSLREVGARLFQNVHLCETLLRARPKSETEPLNLSQTYLANLGLWKLNLRNIDFRRALMPNVSFSQSNLGGAIFEDTILEGTLFYDTELTDTKLYAAGIDVRFLGGNWWRADYEAVWWRDFNLPAPIVNEGLMAQYILRYGELSPEQLKEAHPSVKAYVEKQNQLREDEAANQNTQSSPSATL